MQGFINACYSIHQEVPFKISVIGDVQGLHGHHDSPYMVPCIIPYAFLLYVCMQNILSLSFNLFGLDRGYLNPIPYTPFTILFAYL